jgi:hypothetical protein
MKIENERKLTQLRGALLEALTPVPEDTPPQLLPKASPRASAA